VVPDWLAEVVRPKPAPLPWPDMIRAAPAICVPLSVGFAGLGPLGAQRPVWHTVAGFVVGAAWALLLILPGWLLSRHGQEERDVAAVYQAVADLLSSPPSGFAGRRQALTGALSTAYDTLLRGRSTAAGR
jgi:hypothetical protein